MGASDMGRQAPRASNVGRLVLARLLARAKSTEVNGYHTYTGAHKSSEVNVHHTWAQVTWAGASC